jgi:predicted signal transduction protein with EAL and GGDEF domain
LEQIGEIATPTDPLIPLTRFYTQVESIGTRILSASQDPTLTAIALSQQIINLQLRSRELELLAQGDIWNTENRQILGSLDDLTADLVNYELAAIHQASASVANMNSITFWLLLTVTLAGVLCLVTFFYIHILKGLLVRPEFLSKSMQEIAAGHYHGVMPPSGSDELVRLGAAVKQFHAVAVSAALREEKLQTLSRQLAELSISDSLTGLANRRHFYEVLAGEMRSWQENGIAHCAMDTQWPY